MRVINFRVYGATVYAERNDTHITSAYTLAPYTRKEMCIMLSLSPFLIFPLPFSPFLSLSLPPLTSLLSLSSSLHISHHHPLLQAYQASFRMSHATSVQSSKSYPSLTNPLSNTAMHFCNIAFDALFEDTKLLVAEGVRRDIAHRIASARGKLNLDDATSRGASRESYLKSWLKKDFPLAYGSDGADDTYKLLLQAVNHTDHSVSYGLPNWNEHAVSPLSFVRSLIDMSRPVNPSRPVAPVLRTGSFLPVLTIAHQSILELVKDHPAKAQQTFISNIFRHALKIFKVHFFPSHLSNSGPGSPNVKPVFNSWANIGLRDANAQLPLDGPSCLPESPSIPPETVASNNAIASDCNADWAAKNLTIATLKDVLNKTSLPIDFASPAKSDTAFINDTYRWVRDRYDCRKPLHHLALLVSIIVASTIVPNLFMVQTARHLFEDAHTPSAVRDAYNKIDWISIVGRRGMSDKSIFISMFTTFTIAIYEDDSPLRKEIASSKKKGLGEAWTKKHSQFLSFPNPFHFSSHLLFSLPFSL